MYAWCRRGPYCAALQVHNRPAGRWRRKSQLLNAWVLWHWLAIDFVTQWKLLLYFHWWCAVDKVKQSAGSQVCSSALQQGRMRTGRADCDNWYVHTWGELSLLTNKYVSWLSHTAHEKGCRDIGQQFWWKCKSYLIITPMYVCMCITY